LEAADPHPIETPLPEGPLLPCLVEELSILIRQPLERSGEGSSGFFAVRSSGSAEDGDEHSFAGVFESFLAVEPEHLPRAILLCWAASFTQRFTGYCEHHGLSPEEIGMAVVVQAMIPADSAGVLLTHDPVTGRRSPVINAVRGLGMDLVGGSVAPDEYRRGPDGAWKRRRGSQQSQETLTLQGMRRHRVDPKQRRLPVLTPRQCDELERLGRQVEDLSDAPQDLEWAIHDGQVWLLQARPITGLPQQQTVWTRANLKEVFPELPSPMTASLYERYGAHWLVRQMSSRGFATAHLGPAMRFMRGRPYFNLSLMESVASAVGASTDTVGDYLGSPDERAHAAGFKVDWRAVLRNLLPLCRLVTAGMTVSRRARRVLAEHGRRLAEPVVTEGLPDHALLGQALSVHQSIGQLDGLAVDTATGISLLTTLLQALLPKDAPMEELIATASRTDANPTTRQVRDFERLIERARRDARSQIWLSQLNGQVPDLTELDDPIFSERLDAYLTTYGCQALYDLDSAVRRFSEDPRPVLFSVRAAIKDGNRRTQGCDLEAVRRPAQDGLRELERKSPLRARLARRVLRALGRFFALRETVRLAKAGAVARQREWELTLGHRWAQRGALDRPDHYHWLRIEEAERAVTLDDAAALRWVRERVRRHRAEHAEWAKTPAPDLWCEGPDSEKVPSSVGETDQNAETFRGLPVAPGVVEGEAVVIADPAAVGSFRSGQILVVPVAGPSWTPLFALAGGLVLEIGGTLSHGAMVAREFHLPTVANIPGATRRIRTGDRLRVNGTQGLVQRLAAEGAAEEPQYPVPLKVAA
jgi:pyruvate,water dikinase